MVQEQCQPGHCEFVFQVRLPVGQVGMGGAAVMRMGGVAVILHERSRGDLCGRSGSDFRIGGDGTARWHRANGSTRTWPPYKLADSLPYESTAGLPSN